MMIHLIIVHILLWCSWRLFASGEICTQLEEGKEGEIVCNSNEEIISTMALEIQRNGVFVEVVSCSKQNICNNSFPLQYQVQYQTLLHPKGGQLNVTILNITRNEVSFRCVVNGVRKQEICEPIVYVKANAPRCEAPSETPDHRIALSCATDRIYPNVRCKFHGHIPSNSQAYLKKYPSSINPDDIRAVCKLLINPQSLTPRALSMSVVFYPLRTMYRQDQELHSLKESIIHLTAPTASLGSDCPKDYIAPGSRARCTCQLSSPGFPRGQAQWYNKFNFVVGTKNPQDGSSILNLQYRAADLEPEFECRADTVLNAPKAVLSYSPLFAYGPCEILLETDGDTFNLCPSKSLVTPIICKVDHSHIKPHPLFTIMIDNNVQVEKVEGQMISTYYQYIYWFTGSSGGTYLVTCQVQNSAISTLVHSKNTMVTVREPPHSAPVLITSIGQPGSAIVSFTGVKELDVICLADGGSPRVDQVTLSCGPSKVESSNWIATLRLQITGGVTEQRCYCTAVHVTGCYGKVARLILRHGDVLRNPDDDGLVLKVGVGVGVSALIIIAVIAVLVLVFWVKKRSHSPGLSMDYCYPVVTQAQRQTNAGASSHLHDGNSSGDEHTYIMVADIDLARYYSPNDDYIIPA